MQSLWPGAIHTISPFHWGDGDGKGRILISPRFNHPGFPHGLGDGPILPTTKKAVPGNEPSLTWSAGAVLWCWGSPACPASGHVWDPGLGMPWCLPCPATAADPGIYGTAV